MSTSDFELRTQAQKILDVIAFMPFDQCQPITRHFSDISSCPGIYAIRHKIYGLLYIGKTQNLRKRFAGGHKAFLWAWLDTYPASDIRISFQHIPYQPNPALLLELEAIILRASEPPYNVQIPPEK
jgi:excinuclease UvrABC nuclease subunit